MKKYDTVIVGAGLSALVTAARLYELGKTNIGIYGVASGGTPYIAAINFVLPDNPFGDTPKQYAQDMSKAGYGVGNEEIVEAMCEVTEEGYELLKRWHIVFAKTEEDNLKLRHASGSTFPRSLCSVSALIGDQIGAKLKKQLEKKGVKVNMGCECLQLLVKDNKIYGITIKNEQGKFENMYGNAVVAAWGGVGNLFGTSTYPRDIKGNTIAIAYEAGAKLVDMEFLEYEPMVVISPRGAQGEPCPTAMLGEGAYLLNKNKERFMLEIRPQGEAGSPKTLINKEIWRQVANQKGSPSGGVYVDLRHIAIDTLKAYPWFYNRLMENGVDPSKELIEVGPMAHSYSGGILIDQNYESNVKGLYAVGEACGSVHGACRLAGNAAAQATLSGLLCAEAIAKVEDDPQRLEFPIQYATNKEVYHKFVPEIRKIAAHVLGIYRNEEDLKYAYGYLKALMQGQEVKRDTQTYQVAQSVLIMISAARQRRESRGTHMRTDYTEMKDTFRRGIVIEKVSVKEKE